MQSYKFGDYCVDSIELKCLLISRGLKIAPEIYKKLGDKYRIYPNALTCNCFRLPDGTIVMATDLSFHISTLAAMFSWDNLKLLKYMNDMKTDFNLTLVDGEPMLFYRDEIICQVSFLPASDFFKQKTSAGLPFVGNAVFQGCNWLAFQCLWPCEYAIAGKPCQYCFSGGQYQTLAQRNKSLGKIPTTQDFIEIVKYAIEHDGVDSLQITGGSTFKTEDEERHITAYLQAINQQVGRNNLRGEILLYITPPDNTATIDRYFALGVDRIACSLEVWNDELAAQITPGKREFTTKQRHLDALTYIADKFGAGKAFSNFVIGLEPLESFKEGAQYLVKKGIIPSASIWMPFGKPVLGSMKPPEADYYRAVKEVLADLYLRYNLEPAGGCGLNVCVEKDIWNWAISSKNQGIP